MQNMKLDDFPLITYDKIRYADTDRQGHVNGTVFGTFLETGRVEFLYGEEMKNVIRGCSFVIASLELDLKGEIHWPGQVDIGTGITRIGTSSITIYQELYKDQICVGSARTVIVQVSDETGKSQSFSEEIKELLGKWLLHQ